MMTNTAVGYQIRSRRDEDLPAILELMRLSLGESSVLQRNRDMWNWKHETSPFGQSHVLLAESEDQRIIGLRAFLRWEFKMGEKLLRGVRAVDTATHPDFRRMGLFKNLTLQAVDDVRTEGVDFVFNTPNDQSRPGYLKMGWQTVGFVAPVIKVLNYRRFVIGMARDRLLKRPAQAPEGDYFSENAPFDVDALTSHPGLDELIALDTAHWGQAMHSNRSREYLKWRYSSHPTIDYRAAVIEEGGKISAAAVFRANSRFGLREIVVTELLLKRPDPSLARELINVIKSNVKADYLICYFPVDSVHREFLQGSRFRKIPGQGMILTVNPLSDPLGELEQLANWGLSMGDVELF